MAGGIRAPMDPFRDYRAKIGTIDERIGDFMKGEGDVDEPLTGRSTRWMQQFGFSSSPPGGTDVAILETKAGAVAVASNHGEGEPDLAPGWSAQYDTSENRVRMMTTEGIEVIAEDGKVTINSATDNVEISTDAGDITTISTGGGIRLENKAGNLDLVPTAGLVRMGLGTKRKVARNTDAVNPGLTMATWIAGVSASTGVPAPTDFGNISGGSSDVYAGD